VEYTVFSFEARSCSLKRVITSLFSMCSSTSRQRVMSNVLFLNGRCLASKITRLS